MSDRRAELEAVHKRLCAGDAGAPAEVFVQLYRLLVSVTLRKFPKGLTADEVSDLVTDAVVAYIRHPTRYDPTRSSLFSYLALVVRGDAKNLLQAKARKRAGIAKLVELSSSDGNIDEADLGSRLDAGALIERYGNQLISDEIDAAVLRLMLLGEKSVDAFAEAMGLRSAARDDKASAVKLRRDKLEKRLRRLGEEL